MTLPEFITGTGFLSAAFYLSGNDHLRELLEVFGYFFLTFFSINVANNLDVSRDLYLAMYAVPAVIAGTMTLYILRNDSSKTLGVFVALYLLNIVVNWLHLDMYKIIADIDILDLLVWFQLGLLIRLANKISSWGQRIKSEPDGRDSRISP